MDCDRVSPDGLRTPSEVFGVPTGEPEETKRAKRGEFCGARHRGQSASCPIAEDLHAVRRSVSWQRSPVLTEEPE